tara:strand:+ start:725 stop:1576 length:852 start_codon:yes stop_codon:yes gene_type:complete
MTSSQVNVSETPPVSRADLETLAKNETDENGLILGKFNSVEELAASYKELEGKLGQPSDEEATGESDAVDLPDGYEDNYLPDGSVDYGTVKENYGETLAGIFEEANIDPYRISAEFHKNQGEIPEDMYQSLLDAGLSKPAVDSYLTGRAAEMGYTEGGDGVETIPPAGVQEIRDSIGGDEAYGKMVDWAVSNLPKQEISDFNDATKTMTAPQLKLMVQGLYTQYQNAMGVEPNLISGRPASSGPNPYRSTEEVKAAMRDPRYGKDVTYTQDVYARLEKSDVFG